MSDDILREIKECSSKYVDENADQVEIKEREALVNCVVKSGQNYLALGKAITVLDLDTCMKKDVPNAAS
ncbi:unnamed protein product [Acanthoscelides obtectus]|uniref:Uncharacterized protein n=1 Tax=Acanthoscelides obtectus TaxID=200917 RepID=A0A9P0JM02_ACAOB|nr:unnamed protein product [Acanthoscelides obtectus]CAK1661592.1 hypothetical protein AOBTE_LOCUS22706 [Acanthoscelides obtectus]